MDFELLPAQKEFFIVPESNSSNRDIALYMGGFGSGKTFVGSLMGICLAMKYAGIVGLVGALTYTLLRDTTLKQYLEHLENMGFVDGYHYEYKKAEDKLVFKNGSEILFRHLQEPNKLKSLNLGFVELEEMSDTPESTFKMLLSRLRQNIKPEWAEMGFKYRLFGHTNPEANKGWIYKYFVEQKPDNYRLIQAPTTQNKFLAKDSVESLKEIYDPEYYRINVLGEFGDYTSGLVVKNFNSDNIIDCEYVPTLTLHLSCDFNVDPMCWYIAHIANKKIFFVDEIVMENTYTQQVAQEFLNRYKNHKAKIIINGDASGDYRKTQSQVSDYYIIKDILDKHYGAERVEVDIRRFNPPIKNRIAAWNAKILGGDGERKLFINKKCDKLIYNCYNLKYKEGTSIVDVPTYSQIANDRQLKFLEHPFDAASYLVEYYFPIISYNSEE